jgi:thiopurine S-methyltransferase
VNALVRSGGWLAGFFYFDDNRRGPPFGIAAERLAELLERFERVEDRPASRSLGVFRGRERWQVWKRRL